MVTYCNYNYRADHFEMYRNSKSLCCVTGTNIVLQVNYTSKTNKQTNKQTNLEKKRSDLRFPKARGGGGELDEGGQKGQTSSYKISKYYGCNVQHDKYN